MPRKAGSDNPRNLRHGNAGQSWGVLQGSAANQLGIRQKYHSAACYCSDSSLDYGNTASIKDAFYVKRRATLHLTCLVLKEQPELLEDYGSSRSQCERTIIKNVTSGGANCVSWRTIPHSAFGRHCCPYVNRPALGGIHNFPFYEYCCWECDANSAHSCP
jgi:hypothetical protein